VFSLEKQHLIPVMKEIDIKNNYVSSITRCVHKDNTIRYLSNRYSLPLGTFHKHETVKISVTEDHQLVIFIPETGEIIAKHDIPQGRGNLVKDRNHSRDRTKGIDAYIDTVAEHFPDKKLAYKYLTIVRERYPRYIRDQLQIILRESKKNSKDILSTALNECFKRSLYSATDFSDIISYVKRQRCIEDTTDIDDSVTQLNSTPNWILETESQKRDVDSYTAILEAEYK
jgi:hypothetical protein